MKTPRICCESCGNVYSISDPLFVGGVPRIGTKVSTEIGCPKCLDPDGVIVEDLSVAVCRCLCGWFDYFSSFSESPSICPACSAELVIRNQTDIDEIVIPSSTVN